MYTISGTLIDTETRVRRDAAERLFDQSSYNMIRANAGLDTKRGWQVHWAAGNIYDRNVTGLTVIYGADHVTFEEFQQWCQENGRLSEPGLPSFSNSWD